MKYLSELSAGKARFPILTLCRPSGKQAGRGCPRIRKTRLSHAMPVHGIIGATVFCGDLLTGGAAGHEKSVSEKDPC